MNAKPSAAQVLSLTLIAGLLAGLALAAPPQPSQASSDPFGSPDALGALNALPVPALEQANVTWTGVGGDGRWSNPANWTGHRAPGARDLVRLTGAQDVLIDAIGSIARLVLDANFSGALCLARPLDVAGELVIESGQLVQGAQPVRVAALTQTGGEIVGGSAPFTVNGAAQVQAGLWTTPGDLTTARSLDIAQGATVRLGANGNLVLTGNGTPLTGDGLLDVMTHRPNGVEFKGNTTQDLMLAGPSYQFRAAGLDRQTYDPVPGSPSARLGSTRAFTQVASLELTRGEDYLYSAVIDAANGFAYFGTSTGPGIVVKMDVNPAHTFARVGAITLNTGENGLVSAVLDVANGFAYFGTGDAPGVVVKVDVNPARLFARVGAITLNAGENELISAVLDAANGYAYFGTGYPGVVVKVDVNPTRPFARVGAVTLNALEYRLYSAVLDTANGYAYFSTCAGIVVKMDVNPARPFARVGAVMLNAGEEYLHSAVLDAANGFAYFGTFTSPGIVVKVDVNPAHFARVDAVTLNTGEGELLSAVIDAANGFAYFGTYAHDCSSIVVKVDVNPAHPLARVGAVMLNTGENNLNSAVLDATNGFAYFGTFTTPGIVVKVDVNPAHPFARVGAVKSNKGENYLNSAVLDAANGFAYFGTGDRPYPGIVIKVDVNPAHPFARVGAITLNTGEDSLRSAVLDAANGYAYFGTDTDPGIIVKVDVNPTHPFARVGAVTLNTGEHYLYSAVLDAANGFAYFGAGGHLSAVVKVDVNPAHPFARVDAVTLNAGENYLYSAVLDAANGFAYFGTFTSAGIVIKMDVNPAHFARIGAIVLNTGEDYLWSAVIDAANGFAYFGTNAYGSPGIVVKVDVNPARPFARVGAVTLNAGEEYLTSAVLDAANGFAYFGADYPGTVVKVDVHPAHFARVDAVTLNTGENGLRPALVDEANGFAYFGTCTSPSIIAKIDLGIPSADLSIVKSAEVDFLTNITFTIAVRNFGPNATDGAIVSDTLPSNVASATWTCAWAGGATCTAFGAGNISDTLTTFPSGGAVTYTLQGTLTDWGHVKNTAQIIAPAGIADPTPDDNRATLERYQLLLLPVLKDYPP